MYPLLKNSPVPSAYPVLRKAPNPPAIGNDYLGIAYSSSDSTGRGTIIDIDPGEVRIAE